MERQIDAFVRDYRPTGGELECFAADGKAKVRVHFAEEAAQGDDARIERAIASAIEKTLGKPIPTELESGVDPALIGGLTIETGDTVFDGSLSGMLRRAKEELSSAGSCLS